MDKHPLSVKIICLLLMGLCFAVGVWGFLDLSKYGIGGIGSVLIGYGAFILMGIFGSILISPWFGRKAGGAVYWPEPLGEPPPEFSRIRAKIMDGHVEEALAELGRMLDGDPGNHYLADLATDALMDRLGDYRKAALVLERFLVKDNRDPADAKLVMKLSDAYIDTGRESDAFELLEREVSRFKGVERKPLENRLDALRPTLERG
jgi:tetratricopeptide (TPR) repeat protein